MINNILVIDDDPCITTALKLKLRAEGYKVCSLPSDEMVTQVISHEKIDLVVLDVMLDQKNGFNTFCKLRVWHPGLPVIMISSTATFLEIAEHMGAQETLAKPINLDSLKMAIARITTTLAERLPAVVQNEAA